MKPSVLMFCPQFRPLVGGAERQAEKLAAALVEAGCRVTILTPRLDSGSPDREEANGVTIERFRLTDLSRRYPVSGVAVLNIPYILWQLARAVRPRLKGTDVLHCHIASLETAGAALVGYMCDVPVLCKAATADQRSDLGVIEKTGGTGRLVAWLTRAVIGTWVATTAAVVDALVQAGVKPGRIARIPNGVELRTGCRPRPFSYEARHFLYSGRLSEKTERDIPTLIRAFDRIATKHPDLSSPSSAEVTYSTKLNDSPKPASREIAFSCLASTTLRNGWRGRIASCCLHGEKVCRMPCWRRWRRACPASRTTFLQTERF